MTDDAPLTLITLAGEELPTAVDPNAHACLLGFENAVLAELPYLGCNSTLGCELQFAQTDTHQVLADPIQSKLSANHCYYVIAQQCFVEAAHKGQLKGEAKAIRVPRGRNDKIPPQAFSFHTEVRHVPVEDGIRIVGEAAWRSCRRLQVVHLPETVVSLLHGAFSRCQVLRVVTAPGCKHFGTKVFEERCSLTQIGTTQYPGNILAPSTTAASSVSRVHGPASPQLGRARVWSCISEPTLARLLLLGSRHCRALPATRF